MDFYPVEVMASYRYTADRNVPVGQLSLTCLYQVDLLTGLEGELIDGFWMLPTGQYLDLNLYTQILERHGIDLSGVHGVNDTDECETAYVVDGNGYFERGNSQAIMGWRSYSDQFTAVRFRIDHKGRRVVLEDSGPKATLLDALDCVREASFWWLTHEAIELIQSREYRVRRDTEDLYADRLKYPLGQEVNPSPYEISNPDEF